MLDREESPRARVGKDTDRVVLTMSSISKLYCNEKI